MSPPVNNVLASNWLANPRTSFKCARRVPSLGVRHAWHTGRRQAASCMPVCIREERPPLVCMHAHIRCMVRASSQDLYMRANRIAAKEGDRLESCLSGCLGVGMEWAEAPCNTEYQATGRHLT